MNNRTVVNSVIWWGGLAAYGVYYSLKHPNATFWSSLFDPWGYLVVPVLFLLNFAVSKFFFKEPIEEGLASLADEINKDCPTKLDDWTNLVGASAGPGKKLTYKYTLGTPEGTDLDALKTRLKAHIANSWENDKDSNPVALYDLGVEIVYSYKDSEGRDLFSIVKKKA